MKVVFQSPLTKIWHCVFTKHIDCNGKQIFVYDADNHFILAYEGDDALAQFEHFVEYGRIFNENHKR